MKKLLYTLSAAATVCTLLSLFYLISCSNQFEEIPLVDNTNPIEVRSYDIWPDSVFEAHNDFNIWLFDNYLDSAKYYAHDHVAFLEFANRKSIEYNGEDYDYSDIIDADTSIISQPWYVEGEGFTNTDGYYAWSASEKNNLHTTLDSVITAIDNEASEGTLLTLISRGKTRAENLNTPHENVIINILNQAKFSVQLAIDLHDEHGGSGVNEINWICFMMGIRADMCTIALMHTEVLGAPFKDYTLQEKVNFVKVISGHAFSICFTDC